MSKPPNILFLIADEHRADVAGFAGDPLARTPTLDWLAEGGTVFDNAYTPSPICVPARQCILSGQYPHNCHCEGWLGLQPGHMTWPRRCAQHGYQTVAFGKLHQVGRDPMAGFQLRPVGDVTASLDVPPLEPRYQAPALPSDDGLNCEGWMKWSDEKEVRRAGPGPANHHDHLYTEGFCGWVEENYNGVWYDRATPDRPRALYLGLHDPHYPYRCEEDLFRYYLPRVRDYAIETCFDHPFLGKSAWPQVPLATGIDLPQREVRRARAAYYGKVETMDRRFGQALAALRLAGEDLDEWIIVYCSDHGDQLGEHGIWEKQKFFEGSARVPLIIRAPKYLPAGKRISANVSLCDIFPTLCELCGLQTPDDLDGRSLVSLAKGETTNHHEAVYSFFLQQGYRNGMIKRGQLKFHWYQHEQQGQMPEVLFDLEADPLESRNLIDEPQYAEDLRWFRQQRQALHH